MKLYLASYILYMLSWLYDYNVIVVSHVLLKMVYLDRNM
jgi:hypothetical protein